MGEVTVDDYVLGPDVLFEQHWPKRQIHRCKHRTTNEEFLIKIWWYEADCPAGTQCLTADFNALFDNEVQTLTKLEKSAVGKYLPVLVKFEGTALHLRENNSASVAYELFRPIKHRSLFSYHKKLPEHLLVHLFKEIVEFVVLLNEVHGLSVMNLHPQQIFLTEDQLPCFINVMYTRSLNYRQDGSDIQLGQPFQSPQMQHVNSTYNSQRVDSFQLGVLACYLLCGTLCCQQKNQRLDPLYSHIMKQNHKVFWERIKCEAKPEALKEMIQMLLEPEPVIRIDPYVIKKLGWWHQPYEVPPANTLALIDQKEKEQKEQELLQAKIRAQARPARPPLLPQRIPVNRNGFRSTRSICQQHELTYNSNDYSDCVFFPLRIYETYERLSEHLKHWMQRQNDRAFTMTLEFEDINHPFCVNLRFHNLIDNQEVTIVKFEFQMGEILQCSQRYEQLIEQLKEDSEKCLQK